MDPEWQLWFVGTTLFIAVPLAAYYIAKRF